MTALAPGHPARWVLLLVAVSCVAPASAETLQQAWGQALAHDDGMAAASADAASAQAYEQAAQAARWPTVEANVGYNRLNSSPALDVAMPGGAAFQSGPLFSNNQYVSGSVQMKVPLYAGGRIDAGIEAAHDAAAGAGEIERATIETLKLEVAESYVAVLRARRALQSSDLTVASLRAHVQDVERMVDSETVARSDLLAARVVLANAEQLRVRAEIAVELALAAYNRPLGQPPDRSPVLEERLSMDADITNQPLDSLVALALQNRDELKAAEAQADALSAQARAEAGKLLPQVALTGSYTHFDNQILDRQDFAMVGLGVTWSLFDDQTRHRSSALTIASRAQHERLADLQSQIAFEVRQDWFGVQEGRARLSATGEAVSQADENLRISRQLYDAGQAANTQVLDAVALQVEATKNRDDAMLDESLSRLRLARAIGEL